MRQYLRGEAHGDTLDALRQKQREFHGQGHRLPVTAVVRELPLGRLRVEDGIEGELGETRLDVTWSGRAVARQDISPVSLAIDQQFLLSQLHQRVADRGVAMRMELHGMAHNVGDLIVTPIVEPPHGMEDTTLHRLESIVDVRHGPLKNHVGGIIQEPILVHAGKMICDMRVILVRNLIARVFLCEILWCHRLSSSSIAA